MFATKINVNFGKILNRYFSSFMRAGVFYIKFRVLKGKKLTEENRIHNFLKNANYGAILGLILNPSVACI